MTIEFITQVETEISEVVVKSILRRLVGMGRIDPSVNNESQARGQWLSDIWALVYNRGNIKRAVRDSYEAEKLLIESLPKEWRDSQVRPRIEDHRESITLTLKRFPEEVTSCIKCMSMPNNTSKDAIISELKRGVASVKEGSFVK